MSVQEMYQTMFKTTSIQEAVAGVVGRVSMAERHEMQVAFRFLKSRLSEYRSEERRKVSLPPIVLQWQI